ncbi:MAG: NTP transferase domain-containing protein, partial [Acidobacteriota bacterium]
ADPPGVAGPLAGILAARRWAPGHAWVLLACDLPLAGEEAVRWLLSQRAPGRWAVMPTVTGGLPEPLLALYEPPAASLLERLAASPTPAPCALAGHPRVALVSPPEALRPCFRNVNTAADLVALADNCPGTASS